MQVQVYAFCKNRSRLLDQRFLSYFTGSHNSTLFPSGSINQPNEPYSIFSISPTISAPPSLTCFNASSKLSTIRLNIKPFSEGSKYLVPASNALQTVWPFGGMSFGKYASPQS